MFDLKFKYIFYTVWSVVMDDLPVETSPSVIAVTAAVGGIVLLFMLFCTLSKSKAADNETGLWHISFERYSMLFQIQALWLADKQDSIAYRHANQS